jgi:hypothetical protein
MVASDRLLRWLSWALAVLAIVSAAVSLLFALGLLFPDLGRIDDFVDRLEAFRGADQQVYPFVLLGSLAALGVFLVAAVLGGALRPLAPPGGVRDAMTIVFVVGGTVGIVAQLLNVAVGQTATFSICDCAYRAEELIAQAYSLDIGWTLVRWLALGAVTIVGVGLAFAGRLVDISSAWRTLSYLTAATLLLAVVVRLMDDYISIDGFDFVQISDLMIAAASGIMVPIWAVILARSAGRTRISVS